LSDPAIAAGSDADVLSAFRIIRDVLRQKIAALFENKIA
jgi:hypothetical protein